MTSIVVEPRSPVNRRTLYAGVFEAGVAKSTDDGRNWVIKTNGLGSAENRRVSKVALHADGTLFAMVCARRPAAGKPLSGEGVGLYRSRDGGESWSKTTESTKFLYPKDFSVDLRNSGRILVGVCDAGGGDQSGGLYLTENGGDQWRRIGRKEPQTFGGYFHPAHANWIYMTLTEGAPGDGFWLSRDGGESWQAFSGLPFANAQRPEFLSAEPGKIYLTTFGGSVWRGPDIPSESP